MQYVTRSDSHYYCTAAVAVASVVGGRPITGHPPRVELARCTFESGRTWAPMKCPQLLSGTMEAATGFLEGKLLRFLFQYSIDGTRGICFEMWLNNRVVGMTYYPIPS